jgi:uncharacterized protein (AIM24 family)
MAGDTAQERTMEPNNAEREPAESLRVFLRETGALDGAGQAFENESARTLRIDVDGGVWLKPGAAIAYRGDIAFERLATLDGRSLQDVLLRETAPLVRAVGKGRLYCGQHGSHATLVRLAGESLVVAWPDLLAFEECLSFETSLVGHGVGIAAGGMAVVRLSGHGAAAMATHGRPLTLEVSPGNPVTTDPHATLAWSADLAPVLKTDLSWRSVFRHGGHEPIQMHFEGTGFVVVQPYEDPSRFELKFNPLKRLATLLAG